MNLPAVSVFDEIDPDIFVPLHNLLEEISIPQSRAENRKGFGRARSLVFGLRKARVTREIGLSSASRKYPEIWNEIQKIGAQLNFDYTSVYLNKNVVCEWHTDKGNVGDTVIVSFGDYTGCMLNIQGFGEVETNCRPVKFDGKKLLHCTTPLESGTKYSLVYYTHECGFAAEGGFAAEAGGVYGLVGVPKNRFTSS